MGAKSKFFLKWRKLWEVQDHGFPMLESMLTVFTFFVSVMNKFLCLQVSISYSSYLSAT